MFKTLVRRIVEAVRGAIANEQERTELSVRIPAGYLVACRRAGKKRRTPRRRRQRKVQAENVGLKQKIAATEAEGSQKTDELNKEIKELEEELEATKAKRDREHDARKAAETLVQELQAEKSSLKKDLADVSKELKRKTRFPHLEFGPDAVDDYENLRSDDLPMVEKRLDLLDRSAMAWRVYARKGGVKPGWECRVRDESDSVKRNPKFCEQRRFKSCYGGERYFFWHTNCGELDGRKGRIHFYFDERSQSKEVEIGYIGGHLELPTA